MSESKRATFNQPIPDRNKLWVGEWDRRLEATEERAIRSVLADKKEALLFDMALETAMRLSEMFTLKTEDIDLKNRTIFLHHSKTGHRRQVPISSMLLAKTRSLRARRRVAVFRLVAGW